MIRRALLTILLAVSAFFLAPAGIALASSPGWTWSLDGFADDNGPHTLVAENQQAGTFEVTFTDAVVHTNGTTLTARSLSVSYVINGKTFSYTSPGSVSLTQNQGASLHGSSSSGSFSFNATLGGGDGNYTLRLDSPSVTMGPHTYDPPSGGTVLQSTTTVDTVGLQVQLPYLVGRVVNGLYTYTDSAGLTESGSAYQWYRNLQPISGATSYSYTLTSDDMSQQIMFCVTIHNQYTSNVGGPQACMSNHIDTPAGLGPDQFALSTDPGWAGTVNLSVISNGVTTPMATVANDTYTPEDTETFGPPGIDTTPSLYAVYTYTPSDPIQFIVVGDSMVINP